MKKKDIIIIGIILAVAAVVLVLTGIPSEQESPNAVVIYIGNEVYKRIPLGREQTITVDQGGGKINEVAITERGVHMHSATCANQDCIKQGEVTLDNYKSRVLGSWIICLPNQVSVELVVEEDE